MTVMRRIFSFTAHREMVHVDFDCIFDKGIWGLDRPELTPFRLTRNIVDAFGISEAMAHSEIHANVHLVFCGAMAMFS